MALGTRLAKLEKLAAAWKAATKAAEEHMRLVVQAYAAGAQYVQSPEYRSPGGRLLRRCLDAMSRRHYGHWPDTDIPDEVILAMPPEVAEIYLKHDALPLHECEDCGFRVPVTPGEYLGTPAQRHFEVCPLCGGPTGYAAYFNRRQKGG